MTALIVDDSKFLRQYTRRILEKLGIDCKEAPDGQLALHLLQAGSEIDLMLLDVNMPVLNGLECVRSLRQQGLQPGMRVVMVTTESDHEFIRRALEFGADEFLMKPFTFESLCEKLHLLGISTHSPELRLL